MTTALSFNSNYMADDKATNGKKKTAIYLAVGIAVLLGLVLVGVEIWSYSHKPKINAQI
jgi:heme/copper-type cytochrome/quinol oxidase subunit 3